MSFVNRRPYDPRLAALIGPRRPPQQCLPSGDAARALVRGDPGAFPDVLGATAMRGGLAAVGLAAVGLRGKLLLTGAIGAAVAIEVGVLLWAWYQQHTQRGG